MSTSTVPAPDPNKPAQIEAQANLPRVSFEQFEKIAKTSVLFVAIVYALGVIVTNMYLMRYGISDFSSLKPRYIITGTWVLWILGIVMFPAYKVSVDFHKHSLFVVSLHLLIFTAVSCALFIVTTQLWQFPSIGAQLWTLLPKLAVFPILAMISAKLFRGLDRRLQTSLMGLLCGLAFLSVIAKGLYGRVPDGWGGGRPMPATLILNSEGTKVWQQAGMPIADKTTTNTERIKIIYQDDHNLYVEGSYIDKQQSKAKLAIISRSLVDLILPEPER